MSNLFRRFFHSVEPSESRWPGLAALRSLYTKRLTRAAEDSSGSGNLLGPQSVGGGHKNRGLAQSVSSAVAAPGLSFR